jgi:hypothetical protein|nr:hypothetical protein [Zea mays]
MKLLTRKKKEKPNTGEEGLGSRRKERENRVQLQAEAEAEEEEEDAAAPRRRLRRSVSMGSRLASAAREQRARLYIMRRCVSMLVRWKHD